jgi:two-component system cell cycle response regulator DivK
VTRDVLLIEDNEQNRYLTTFLLEQHGYRVRSVADGARGVEAAKAVVPSFILLDIQLPGTDGYAVARALRADASLRDIPIVAVTSYAMPGDRERALEAGCTGYLEKPIDPETFVADVQRAIAPPSSAPPPSAQST